MLKTFTLTACLLGLSGLTMAKETTEQSDLHICAIKGTPDSSQFQVKKRIKVAKGTYGSVEELYSRFAERAHQVGGNVVINYSQPTIWFLALAYGTACNFGYCS